ncbi:MAG: DNA repair protein RecN [Spirochaetaceae bacterium]|jgi:DNA repair protein RecN (Recombination protein N)|nr:DNA repair protein RecN [Spirochaetaceae bacterium]
MLEELSVRNYALIENLTLSFENGLNILTGETGAGKSIIVGSLSFLLGAKADPEVIRTGSEEAAVSAVISVDEKNQDLLTWLKEREIEIEDGKLIVRRNIKTSGRGSIFIQNVPLTRTDLADCMACLFDLHGQHAHESLLRKETHRRYLDRFAGLEEEAAEFNRVFLELADSKKAMETSLHHERDREARIEILQYAVDEINRADPQKGESRELEAEAVRLSDFEKLAGQVNGAAASLFDAEPSVLSLARRARSALEGAAAIDGELTALHKRLEDLYYEAEDLSEELRSYRNGLRDDPGRLEEVEERLALLYRLKKKYGSPASPGESADEESLLRYREEAEKEIETLSRAEENREKLKAEISSRERDVALRAASLSGKRKAGALKLGEKITGILMSLGMPQARFSAGLRPKGQVPGQAPGSGNLTCGPWGAEDVEFLISANAGEPLKDLSRIASGGELSRVMLAIKTVLADADTIETLVFDEIDTGIGGEVALSVGEYLAKIGKLKQIFCITHLASIAVRADNHLRVEKKTLAGRTITTVSVLNTQERREEIARMLAGDSAAHAALAHADELLAKYGKPKAVSKLTGA